MNAIAAPRAGLGGRAGNDMSQQAEGPPQAEGPDDREGGSPYLTLDGFTGPLEHLLTLARAQKIDLAGISLTTLIDQLAAALRQAPAAMPLGQKGDWVVMAAWLVQLRARLLLPADAPAGQDAKTEADQLRTRLGALQTMQALTVWLDQQPQLGRDVFARGHPPSRARSPEMFAMSVEAEPAIDVIEFLWASLALFDDEAPADTATAYRPAPLPLHTVAQARERILQRLSDKPAGVPLEHLLPDASPDAGNAPSRALRRRSGWTTTFVAGLELARQGTVAMEQGGDFAPIHVAPA